MRRLAGRLPPPGGLVLLTPFGRSAFACGPPEAQCGGLRRIRPVMNALGPGAYEGNARRIRGDSAGV